MIHNPLRQCFEKERLRVEHDTVRVFNGFVKVVLGMGDFTYIVEVARQETLDYIGGQVIIM